MQYVDNLVRESCFPSTVQWKRIVKSKVISHEERCFQQRLNSDPDFTFFKEIHNSIEPHGPHRAWKVALKYGHMITQCNFVISLCALVKPTEQNCELLCHKCGYFYNDPIIHIIATCSSVRSIQDELWCEIINIGPIEFSVVLHSMNETNLALNILSCNSDCFFELSPDDSERFSVTCVRYIYRMCRNYNE